MGSLIKFWTKIEERRVSLPVELSDSSVTETEVFVSQRKKIDEISLKQYRQGKLPHKLTLCLTTDFIVYIDSLWREDQKSEV